MISYGYIEIEGIRLYGMPEDYSMFDRGSKSQIIGNTNTPILDPGYGVLGFTLNGWVLDANSVIVLDQLAKTALKTATPLTVIDTIGMKSNWTGYLERPVIKTGKAYCSDFNLPGAVFLTQVPITFFSNEIELL